MSIGTQLRRLEESGGGSYCSVRAAAQLDYLSRLFRASSVDSAAALPAAPAEGKAEGLAAVERQAALLAERAAKRGCVTGEDLASMEEALALWGPACKALALSCAGHAHIDMNWMWGYHETVAITIDTMRTVLALMEKYPDFRFSQSQASVYAIIERFAPAMVEPMRARIAEGRWESLACQWVESDMVLPSGESLVRQMLYARRYMREVYAAPDSSFETVFLPDSFGYPASTPEILASAGVKHLYHCRGAEDRIAYRWRAPTGAQVLSYREPTWYNLEVGAGIARFLPGFARDTGLKTALLVYGVGDHGGGPTMRDIERLRDMAAWPLFPTIGFGSLGAYFASLEGQADRLPLFEGEPERLFTGCYSSQSRIKAANSRSQEALYEAELLEAGLSIRAPAAGANKAPPLHGPLREAWVDCLFGQFHDILPGSGLRETRERALGLYQGAMALALSSSSQAMAALAAAAGGQGGQAAPQAGEGPESWIASRAEGGGAGFGADLYGLSSATRGSKPGERSFFLFNQLQWRRKERRELVLWDWPATSVAAFFDGAGKPLPSQLLEKSKEAYWGHSFAKYLVEVELEGFGFGRVTARESEDEGEVTDYHPYGTSDWLVEKDRSYILENELLRAVFDTAGLGIISLVDKRSGIDLVAGRGPGASFRLIEEDAPAMTAWIVGRRRSVERLDGATRLIAAKTGAELQEQSIEYRTELPAPPGTTPSTVTVRVSLAKGCARLRFDAVCDWRELGSPGAPLRQLDFALSLSEELSRGAKSLRDSPFAVAVGPSSERDSPATSFMAAVPARGPLLQITAPGKQAFRLERGTLGVTLLRGSTDPDPYPEIGRHNFSIFVSVHGAGSPPELLVRESLSLRHPILAVSGGGDILADPGPLLEVGGRGVVVSSLKLPEGEAWSRPRETAPQARAILRLYETEGLATEASVSARGLKSWRLLDTHERPVGLFGAGPGRIRLGPFGIACLELQFEAVERERT